MDIFCAFISPFLSALSFNMSYDVYMMMYKTTKAIMLQGAGGMENGFDADGKQVI